MKQNNPMKTFKITYTNVYGQTDFMTQRASEKWMIEGKIEEWMLGTTIAIEEV